MTEQPMSVMTQRILLAVGLVLALLLQFRIWWDDSGVLASRELDQRIGRIAEDIRVLDDRNHQMQLEVEDLRHGSAILEEKAREDLGLVRDGETLILFVEPEQ
ncbi:FtsB family cell division protein [Oceanobacter mangrovi]|uniref:FtsB family cell division protein n=1 Tax=Oceanobacter mangrovi TaxID=2862510 RepID=UPI001C8D6273|nr:septum formation initiator family protein [Oceanobacter mangrovi]